MATQRHRWFTRANNREGRRRAALWDMALNLARAQFAGVLGEAVAYAGTTVAKAEIAVAVELVQLK